MEHEASTSKIGDDQIFYCNQRGLSAQDAVNMVVNGFCRDVFQKLPMEFAVEARKTPGGEPEREGWIAAGYWLDADKVLAPFVRESHPECSEVRAGFTACFDLATRNNL